MDVGQQLGEHGPGVHQVSHQRFSPQTGGSEKRSPPQTITIITWPSSIQSSSGGSK